MKHLLKYFKGYLKEAALGPFFKLLEALIELFVPLVIAIIMDKIIPAGDNRQLMLMISLLIGLAILGWIVSVTAQYYSAKVAVGYTQKLTDNLFQKIIALSPEEKDRIGDSSLISRMTSDSLQVQSGINFFLRLFLRSPFIVFGAIVMAYTISPSIAKWFIIMVGLLFLVVIFLSRLLNPKYLHLREKLDQIITLSREQLQGIRVIRAFNQSKREQKQFFTLNQLYTEKQLKVGVLSSLVSPLTFVIVNIILLVVIWEGHLSIVSNVITQGMLIALVNYLLQILVELVKLAMLLGTLNQSLISANRIAAVFALPEEDLGQELPIVTSDTLSLNVSRLSFTYPNASEPSLKHISVALEKNQFLGIIGGTGSGKTTLIKLISSLYQSSNLSLTIFHQNHSPRYLEEWRNWVAVVPQKAELFQGTIRSNLNLGLEKEVSDDDLWQALDMAQALDFVKEKEGTLDAPVEAFGQNFSGGQRQRLTIARALLRKTPFLLLDDATSALDYLTESRLLSRLRQELTDTTLIMVSQRTRSLQYADNILVLDKGEQVGLGNHEELLATNTMYQEIYNSQEKEVTDA